MVPPNKRVLVTGAAGFIGASIASRLIKKGLDVRGLDNFSDYYHPGLKHHHTKKLGLENFISDLDICNYEDLLRLYASFAPDVVVHLAAQGGVRASESNPLPYIQTNQFGFYNLLRLNEEFGVKEFIYASSSSVYGEGLPTPFLESMSLPGPKSLYAASKVANELMAENFLLNADHRRIGLRFFTVYGPWGRPDMAISRLLSSALINREFVLTANMDLVRDFTYVEDVADVVEDLIDLDKQDFSQHTIFNVSGESPRTMGELIQICTNLCFGLRVVQGDRNKSDVSVTHGSNEKLKNFGVRVPRTSLEKGIEATSLWIADAENADILGYLA